MLSLYLSPYWDMTACNQPIINAIHNYRIAVSKSKRNEVYHHD